MPDVQGDETVFAGHERSGTALLRLPGVQSAEYLGREHRRRGFKSRHLYVLAAAGDVPVREGGHRAQKRARACLECRLESGLLQRLSFGRAVGVALTGRRVLYELSGDVVTPRTGLAEWRDRDVYQPGVTGFERLIRKSQRVHVSRRKRLHQHVSVHEKVGGVGASALRHDIQRDPVLVAVQVDENPTRLGVGPVTWERAEGSVNRRRRGVRP